MNAEPHTHDVTVKREYQSIDSGAWELHYGDTHVNIKRWGRIQPTEKQIARATKRAIRKHDVGSIKAGEDQDALNAGKEYARTLRPQDLSHWPDQEAVKLKEEQDKLTAEQNKAWADSMMAPVSGSITSGELEHAATHAYTRSRDGVSGHVYYGSMRFIEPYEYKLTQREEAIKREIMKGVTS